MRTLALILATPLFVTTVLADDTKPAAPPVTRVELVTDEYHGVRVADPYRWLENWDDAEVKEWSAAQNKYARSVLDTLPNVEAIRARLTRLLSAEVPSHGDFKFAGGRLFSQKRVPPAQQPFLVWRSWPTEANPETVLIDLNTLDATHSTSMDWYVPSKDGKYVAVALSTGGSEMADVHFYDVATGKETFEALPRVNGGTAGGSLAWRSDNSGVFYTRYPRGGEKSGADVNFYVQVYSHQFGTPTEKDTYEIGKDFPKIAEIVLETSADAKGQEWCLAGVQKGDGGEFMHFLRVPEAQGVTGAWTQVSRYEDQLVEAVLGQDGFAYFISRKDAPRGKVTRLALVHTKLDAFEPVIAQSEATIENDFLGGETLCVTANNIYAQCQTGGPSEVRVFDKKGVRGRGPELFAVSSAGGMCVLDGDSVLFANTSYLDPTTWKIFTPGKGKDESGKTVATTWGPKYDFIDVSGYEVRREMATSKDGTKVPLNIVCRKGTVLDGSNPTLLSGYGGYGVSIGPGFSLRDVALLEQGFVLAEANLRGGGEFGEEWHTQGNLTKKQNVFDDFAACAEHLISRKYTGKSKLAIEGGSNGGLLMGAAFTQHPDLFACVVSHVGIYDMLRVELSPNGEFNITEFGTVKDKAQFAALHAYSPYHHVSPGTTYPPVLFLTGANDPRVDPMQSRKMTALLQAAGANVLLRTSSNTGHGAGTPLNARIEQSVDVVAFLCERVGVQYAGGK